MSRNENLITINRKAWDSRASLHLTSDFYDVPGFKAGRSSLNSIEREALGEPAGRKILHLQCHFGQDTLSLARLGAKVTGVDFSPQAIDIAKDLSEELSIEAEFVCSDVLELELQREFDLVFTSYGALTWLPDLERWADRVVTHLAPGGRLVVVEFHPTLMMFDFESRKPAYDYFRRHYREEVAGSYAVTDSEQRHTEHFWTFSLQDVITPLLDRQLALLDFREYDYSPYGCFPGMVEEEPGQWRWETRIRLPHVFSLIMQKLS